MPTPNTELGKRLTRWQLPQTAPAPLSIENPVQADLAAAADEIERSRMVHVVICTADNSEVSHIFSTRELAEAFMASDGRRHIYYDYVLDCPERLETRQQ